MQAINRVVLTVVGVTAVALLISGTAQANSAMRKDTRIDGELFAVAVGDRIRKECETISARMGVVWSRARALERYARDAGFSRNEIEAYLDSKADQNRFKSRAKSYLAKNGAVAGQPESYCKVGRQEIAQKSAIGTLLKAR